MFVLFGGLIVLALFAALIAPFFIDWTAYRTAFEREATKIVGQPVQVAGTAKVRILPMPSVTFTELTVGENPDGTPMMTVDSFAMRAELMPFLSGQVRIVDMVLVRPDLSVTVDEGGTVAWTARQEMLVDPGKVRVENLRIEDGALRIEGLAGGRVIRGEDFGAILSAQSLTGPWQIEAHGRIDDVPVALSMSTGRLQAEGAIRVKAVARRSGQPYRLTLDGPLALKEEVLTWEGKFEVQPSGDPVVAGEGILSEPLPVRVSGQFSATPEHVELPEYRMEVGPREDPYTITGTASAEIRERVAFKATADGRQIDLDRLQAAAPAAGAGVGLDQRIAGLRDLVDRIPVPSAQGEIDVLLPAVVAGDTVIREVRASVEPDGDGWQVRRFVATLPGNTTVEARGRLGTAGDFGFSGHMVLATRQPTGFAAWLAGKSNASLRQLDRAGFSADVTLSGRQSTFDNLELVLDEATLRGKLQRLAPVGGQGRPAIVAELDGDRINTDDLMAIYSLTETGGGKELTDHDLDIAIRAGVLEGQRLEAQNVDARLRIEAGSVSIDHLEIGDFRGARIAGSGRLVDVLERPGGRLDLTLAARDGSRLAALALDRLGPNRFLEALAGDPALSEDLSMKLEVEARPQDDASRGTLTLSGWASGTAFAFRDRFEGRPSRWRDATHDLFAKFEQDDPLVLARQFALPVTPLGASGPVTVTAELSGRLGGEMAVNLAANATDTDLSASGGMTFETDRETPPDAADGAGFGVSRFDLAVTLGTQDIDPWLLMAGYPMPGTGEGHPASLAFEAKGEKGVYRLEGLTGTHGTNGFSGDVELDTVHAARPKLRGALTFDLVSAPFAAELLLGAGTIAGDGLDAGPADRQFGVPMVEGVDVELKLSADHLETGGGPQASALTADVVLIDGALSLPQFSAGWADGTMTGNLALRNVSGNATLNTQLTLAGVDAGTLARMAGFAPVVHGEADIGMTLDSSGRSFKGLVSALSGSGVFRLGDAVVEGVSTAGLEDILEQADREGFEITAEHVRPLARSAMLTGRLAADAVSGAFSVGRGQVSVRNVELADEGGTLEASGSYDPVTGDTLITATLKLDPGDSALSGADPAADLAWSGTPGTLEARLDSQTLEGYLSLRAYEREQRKVEILQEAVLEKQRLRRETILTRTRMARREAARDEELKRLETLQQQLQPGPDGATGDGAADDSPEAGGAGLRDPLGEGAPTEGGAPSDPAPPGFVLPARPEETPVPEPSPSRVGIVQPGQERDLPVVEAQPLPAPAGNSKDADGSDLFEEIRRKLFGDDGL